MIERSRLVKFEKDLEKLYKKHDLQFVPCDYWGSVEEYDGSVDGVLVEEYDREVKAREERAEAMRKQAERRAQCDRKGHVWGEWKYQSISSTGPYAIRWCSVCSEHDIGKV